MRALATPEVLFWARDSLGFCVEDIAKELNKKTITPDTILSWEEGSAQPSYAQLEQLAKIYKRPIAVFFFPEPPTEKSIHTKLRALPKQYAKSLPAEIRYLVRKAQSKKINLYEIYSDILPNDFQSFSHSFNNSKNNSQSLANAVRDWFNISLDDQWNWKDSDAALKNWRRKLEEVGIWIFKESFDKEYSGFCLSDTYIPVIYINNGMSKNRQIFTLFHELAHILIEKSGVDFRDNVENKFNGAYQEDEIFCNAFAGQFLVPKKSIATNDYSDEKISSLANQYKVSREVILRKYLDKGIIQRDVYFDKIEKYHLEWNENEKKKQKEKERNKQLGKKSSGPSYYLTQKSYLGDKYLSLAFSQYYKNRINETQLADYLGVKVKSLSGFEGYMLESQK